MRAGLTPTRKGLFKKLEIELNLKEVREAKEGKHSRYGEHPMKSRVRIWSVACEEKKECQCTWFVDYAEKRKD